MKIIFVSPSFARFCYTFILVNYNFEQVIISRNYFPSNYLSKHISEYISYFPLLKLESAVDLTWVWISLFSRSKVTKEYLIRVVNNLFPLPDMMLDVCTTHFGHFVFLLDMLFTLSWHSPLCVQPVPKYSFYNTFVFH